MYKGIKTISNALENELNKYEKDGYSLISIHQEIEPQRATTQYVVILNKEITDDINPDLIV